MPRYHAGMMRGGRHRGDVPWPAYLLLVTIAVLVVASALRLHARQLEQEQATRWTRIAADIDAILAAVNHHLLLLGAELEHPPGQPDLALPVRHHPSWQGWSARLEVRERGTPVPVHLSGAGPRPPEAAGRELAAALQAAPLMLASRRNLPEATWIYYLSARRFLLAVPWVDPATYHYTDTLLEKPFYRDLEPANNPRLEPRWTEPYQDEFGQGLMVTAARPVVEEGRFSGVVAIDLTLRQLTRLLGEVGPMIRGAYLIDDHGHILAERDPRPAPKADAQPVPDIAQRLPQDISVEQARSALAAGGLQQIGHYRLRVLPLAEAPWKLVVCQTDGAFWWQVLRGMKGELLILVLLGLMALLLERYRRMHARLLIMEDRFRDTTELLPEIIYEADANGNVTFLNQVGMERLGYGQEDLGRLNLRDLFVFRPPERPGVGNCSARLEMEYLVQSRSGEQFPALLRACPIRAHGQIVGERGILIDISELRRYQQELEQLATTDYLTGCYNRRMFMELAELEYKRCRRRRRPCAVLTLDIDHFKHINDSWGHKAGDETLRHFVSVLQQVLRDTDILGRTGGEEFAVLLPDADLDQAEEIAERIRERVASSPLQYGRIRIPLTVSIGVVALEGEGLDTALRQADHALYSAKKEGRNRVVSWV
ncbi:MAG: diguanylate cyclase [Gammaproteobacteria bacterium]|nr:MAG: diguanylate cyclase [Gammaproteobacteria bacterium]